MKIINNNVAIVGDLHLGLHQSNNVWHSISLNYGNWLKQTLIKNNIKDIIFLGDIIDNRNEVAVPTLHVLNKFFKILEDFNIIIITGNHDCYYSKRTDVHSLGTLHDWPNINVVDKITNVNFFNKNISFCPWSTQIQDIQKCDIIFGHFEINTFKMNGGHVCEVGIDSKSLLEKANLIMSGHFHKNDEREYKSGGKIIYVGSTYQNNWGEYGEQKGIYILDLKDLTTTFLHNNYSPIHVKIRLSELLAIGKISENIKKELDNNIVNFIVDHEIEQKSIDALLTKLYTFNPISIKIENTILESNIVTTEDDLKFEGIDIKKDIIEFINDLGDIENKNDIIKYVTETYDHCYNEAKI